jgi:hypothetical protein
MMASKKKKEESSKIMDANQKAKSQSHIFNLFSLLLSL